MEPPQNSLALIDPYRDAIREALGFAFTGECLHVGSLLPFTIPAAVEAIGKKYRDDLAENAAAYGIDRSSGDPVEFEDFVRGVENAEKFSRAYDQQDSGRIGYVHDDTPQMRALVTQHLTPRIKPTAEGYANYLANIAPAVWPALTEPLPVSLPASERRRHSYIVGATGSGKSQLLKVLAAEHAKLGDALVIVDPHSSFAAETARLPDIACGGRLIYIRPGMEGLSPVINPLEAPPGATVADKAKIAEHLAAAIDIITGGTSTARMISFFGSIITILMDKPGATLLDLFEMTSRTKLPPDVIALGLKHPSRMVRSYFEEDIHGEDVRSAVAGVRARLRLLLQSHGVTELLCGKSTIDLEGEIQDGKTVVFDLGMLGSRAASDVGKLVLALMTALGERRKVNQALPRNPVHVIVDECQHIVNDSTTTILDELRKYGIHLTLAQQRAGQDMSRRVKEAVLYAPAVQMCGATNPGDKSREALSLEGDGLPPVLVADKKQNLFQFVCRWGRNSKPFVLNVRTDLAELAVDDDAWDDVLSDQFAAYYAETGRDDEEDESEDPGEPGKPPKGEMPLL